MGISGGGPSACRFAIRYSERLSSLLLQVAVTGNYVSPYLEDIKSTPTKIFFTSVTVARMMRANKLEKSIPEFLKAVSKYDRAKIAAETKEIIEDPRRAAVMKKTNDANVMNPAYCHHYSSMLFEVPLFNTDLELPKIKIPTFIVHGDSDNIVYLSNGEQAHTQIEGSKFLKVEDGHHDLDLHKDHPKIFQQQADFVKENWSPKTMDWY